MMLIYVVNRSRPSYQRDRRKRKLDSQTEHQRGSSEVFPRGVYKIVMGISGFRKSELFGSVKSGFRKF
jgi:hypothetical protein